MKIFTCFHKNEDVTWMAALLSKVISEGKKELRPLAQKSLLSKQLKAKKAINLLITQGKASPRT